ncbi:MAG: hypothetical protein ABJG78_14790 [Cyclobacteriaceae bacterium]
MLNRELVESIQDPSYRNIVDSLESGKSRLDLKDSVQLEVLQTKFEADQLDLPTLGDLILTGSFFLSIALILIIVIPYLQTRTLNNVSTRLELQNKLRTTWAQVFGGVGLLLTFLTGYIGIRLENNQFLTQNRIQTIESRLERRQEQHNSILSLHQQIEASKINANAQMESMEKNAHALITSSTNNSEALNNATNVQRTRNEQTHQRETFDRALEYLTNAKTPLDEIVGLEILYDLGKTELYASRVRGVLRSFITERRRFDYKEVILSFLDSSAFNYLVDYNPSDGNSIWVMSTPENFLYKYGQIDDLVPKEERISRENARSELRAKMLETDERVKTDADNMFFEEIRFDSVNYPDYLIFNNLANLSRLRFVDFLLRGSSTLSSVFPQHTQDASWDEYYLLIPDYILDFSQSSQTSLAIKILANLTPQEEMIEFEGGYFYLEEMQNARFAYTLATIQAPSPPPSLEYYSQESLIISTNPIDMSQIANNSELHSKLPYVAAYFHKSNKSNISFYAISLVDLIHILP